MDRSADFGSNTYLALLHSQLEKRARVIRRPYKRPAFQPPPRAEEPEKPDWEAFVALWKEREKRCAPPPAFSTPTRMERDDEGPAPVTRAVELGQACHRVMEHLDFGAPSVPGGTDPEAAEILEGFFGSEAFRELSGAEILAREMPFVFRREGQIVEGVIDVVYRHGGKVFAADYKTDKMIAPGEYALIREIYGGAVRRMFEVDAGFKLFYLRHGRGVEP